MQTYIVKSGDTLSKLAKTFYGDASQYPRIAQANGIIAPYVILIGQRLLIPEDIDALQEQQVSAQYMLGEQAVTAQRLPDVTASEPEILAEVEVRKTKVAPWVLVLAAIAAILILAYAGKARGTRRRRNQKK